MESGGFLKEYRARLATHHWVNKKTGEASSLPKIFIFSSIAWIGFLMPYIITGSGILFSFSVVTGIIGSVSALLMMKNCDYVEYSKEEQRLLKEKRINQEGANFLERH